MNDHRDKQYPLTLLFIGSIALSVVLWWISYLTGGPENGGRYDVPAINGAAWWAFLLSIPAVLIVGNLWMTRLAEWVDSRRRRRHARPDRSLGPYSNRHACSERALGSPVSSSPIR